MSVGCSLISVRPCLNSVLFSNCRGNLQCNNMRNFFINYRRHFGSVSSNQSGRMSTTWRSQSDKREVDIVIVGGGVMGSSTAHFLSQRMPGERICVVERDPTYSLSSSILSACSIRQQFSLPENIQMSMYGYHFISEIQKHLSVRDCDPPDVHFKSAGYLFLATDEGVETLQENHQIQRSLGVDVVLLTPAQLKEKFPWLNINGISLASYGLKREGYFDPYSLLCCFKRKARSQGVQYIDGEVVDISKESKLVTGVEIQTTQGRINLGCRRLVNAAGAWCRHIADLAGLKLPVEARKRIIFSINCPNGPTHVPLVVDPTGFYIRSDGGSRYITGKSPSEEEDVETDNLDVDYDFFMEVLWPLLADRVPVFEELKILSAWGGFYEVNTLDHNAILGPHPDVENFYFINGFSGHGLQQSPAAGRAISELIIDGSFQTLDLNRFSYQRISEKKPIYEKNII